MFPGRRLEMSFVRKKTKPYQCEKFHFPGSCSSSLALHCTGLFSYSVWSGRVTQLEPRSHLNWGGARSPSWRPAQMAHVSAWQATWDPPDQHGVASTYPSNQRVLPWQGMHVQFVLTCDQYLLREGERLTGSWMAGWFMKESKIVFKLKLCVQCIKWLHF